MSPASPDRPDRSAPPDACRRTALVCAVLGTVPIGTRADPTRSELALDDAQRAWIAARPVVRWTAIFEARPYLAYRGGPPEGLVVDILKRVTASTGLRFEYLPSKTHDEGFGRLRDGGVDLLPMLGMTPERRREFAFTAPYARYALGIFTRRRYSYLESPADLAGLKVGVPRGLDTMVAEASPQAGLVRFEDIADGVRALSARSIDALVAPVPVVRHWILTLGADELWMQAVLPVQSALGMAALPSAAPLIGVLDAVLRRIHAPERRELIDAWTDAGPEWPGRLAGPTATVVLAAAAGTGWWLYRRRARRADTG